MAGGTRASMLLAASMRWMRRSRPMLDGSARRQLLEMSSLVRQGSSPIVSGSDSSRLFSSRSTCKGISPTAVCLTHSFDPATNADMANMHVLLFPPPLLPSTGLQPYL